VQAIFASEGCIAVALGALPFYLSHNAMESVCFRLTIRHRARGISMQARLINVMPKGQCAALLASLAVSQNSVLVARVEVQKCTPDRFTHRRLERQIEKMIQRLFTKATR
jgi:hypothetical protein